MTTKGLGSGLGLGLGLGLGSAKVEVLPINIYINKYKICALHVYTTW